MRETFQQTGAATRHACMGGWLWGSPGCDIPKTISTAPLCACCDARQSTSMQPQTNNRTGPIAATQRKIPAPTESRTQPGLGVVQECGGGLDAGLFAGNRLAGQLAAIDQDGRAA